MARVSETGQGSAAEADIFGAMHNGGITEADWVAHIAEVYILDNPVHFSRTALVHLGLHVQSHLLEALTSTQFHGPWLNKPQAQSNLKQLRS